LTFGCSYGKGTGHVLGDFDAEERKPQGCTILYKRNDELSAQTKVGFNVTENRIKLPSEISRVIPGHGGHHPGWQQSFGTTVGKYGSEKYMAFTRSTRRPLSPPRPIVSPQSIFDLPEPSRDNLTEPLYRDCRFYVPGTTLHVPGMRERHFSTYSQLTADAFLNPVPMLPQPLDRPEDGPQIPHLELPAGYAGNIPRVLPSFIPQRRPSSRLGSAGRHIASAS